MFPDSAQGVPQHIGKYKMYLEGKTDQETGPQAQRSERGELELLVASDRESTTTSFSTRRELMGPRE